MLRRHLGGNPERQPLEALVQVVVVVVMAEQHRVDRAVGPPM
jgi:hypothetical protein